METSAYTRKCYATARAVRHEMTEAGGKTLLRSVFGLAMSDKVWEVGIPAQERLSTEKRVEQLKQYKEIGKGEC